MSKKIKLMFKNHIKLLESRRDPKTKRLNPYAAYAMEEIIGLYSRIEGLSYDEAAESLHEED